jgi:glycosyltransferase involved in cell wall biosynthesis
MVYANEQADYCFYLSDRLNQKLNGKILHDARHQTVMWGIAYQQKTTYRKWNGVICMSGVIKDNQGVWNLLQVVRDTVGLKVKIIGPCDTSLYQKFTYFIQKYNIQSRVYFPNQIMYGKELEREFADCSVGMALYDIGPSCGTYFADPAKVKTYTQQGLPVIMTDSAEIAYILQKFRAGEIIDRNTKNIQNAVRKIQKNYPTYQKGVQDFNMYFDFREYYRKRFTALEKKLL